MFVELNCNSMNKYNLVLYLYQYISIIVIAVEEDKHMDQVVEEPK